MYDARTSLIIGFHGCDQSVVDALLKKPDSIKVSREPYDWLGHGMYFWGNNYDRALQWAKDKKKNRGTIKNLAVIGGVLNLGYCCDPHFIPLITSRTNAELHLLRCQSRIKATFYSPL